MSAIRPEAGSPGRSGKAAQPIAAFVRIVAIFVLFGPLVFAVAAMLMFAAFVFVIEPGNLGDVATISAGAVLIAYIVGLVPAAATGLVVAIRHFGVGGAGPLMAALTGGGLSAAILLAAMGARGGFRLIIKNPAVPLWLILSAAVASLICWWIAIGRQKARRPEATQ